MHFRILEMEQGLGDLEVVQIEKGLKKGVSVTDLKDLL